MIKEIMYFLIVILGFFSGFIMFRLCKDEMRKWRKKFFFIFILSLSLELIIYFFNFEYKTPLMLTLIFIMVYCLSLIVRNG